MNNNLTELSTTEAIKAESQRHSVSEEAILMCRSLASNFETIFEALIGATDKSSLASRLSAIGKSESETYVGMVDGMHESFIERAIKLNVDDKTMGDKRNHIDNSLDEINISYDSIVTLESIFITIKDNPQNSYYIRGLARLGFYVAEDQLNQIDCMRGDIERACGFRELRSVS